MKKDDFGNRMKSYENGNKNFLENKKPVIVRLDGRAFHTYTKTLDKPFDKSFQNAMIKSSIEVASQMENFRFGYTQSDEVSFLMLETNDESQSWFNNNQQKISTISASLMTSYFRDKMVSEIEKNLTKDIIISDVEKELTKNKKSKNIYNKDVLKMLKSGDDYSDAILDTVKRSYVNFYKNYIAVFDGRSFNIPFGPEVVNYFLWRAKDWERNSINMVGRNFFSAKALNKKCKQDVFNMLLEKGVNYDTDYDNICKYGTFFYKKNEKIEVVFIKPRYNEIAKVIGDILHVDLLTKEK